jgi:hypothetical protein
MIRWLALAITLFAVNMASGQIDHYFKINEIALNGGVSLSVAHSSGTRELNYGGSFLYPIRVFPSEERNYYSEDLNVNLETTFTILNQEFLFGFMSYRQTMRMGLRAQSVGYSNFRHRDYNFTIKSLQFGLAYNILSNRASRIKYYVGLDISDGVEGMVPIKYGKSTIYDTTIVSYKITSIGSSYSNYFITNKIRYLIYNSEWIRLKGFADFRFGLVNYYSLGFIYSYSTGAGNNERFSDIFRVTTNGTNAFVGVSISLKLEKGFFPYIEK